MKRFRNLDFLDELVLKESCDIQPDVEASAILSGRIESTEAYSLSVVQRCYLRSAERGVIISRELAVERIHEITLGIVGQSQTHWV